MAHGIGVDVILYSINSVEYEANLVNGKITIENKSEEGKGIIDLDDFPEMVGRTVTIEGEMMVATVAALMSAAINATPEFLFDIDTGFNEYSGTGFLKTAGHTFKREGIQMQKATLICKGGLTITPPA